DAIKSDKNAIAYWRLGEKTMEMPAKDQIDGHDGTYQVMSVMADLNDPSAKSPGAPGDLDGAFATITRESVSAVLVSGGTVLFAIRAQVAGRGLRGRHPMMCSLPDYVAAGCLMSYGPSLTDLFRRAATYVDKILKGAKPADLPVEQPIKFELVINLKTAKALGLTIPPSVLLRADHIID